MTTTLDGTYTATVDRIEEGLAVFLIEDDGETIDEHLHPAADLPDGIEEGMVCEATFEHGELVGVEAQPETTAERRQRIREKFDRLSERLGGDRDEE